MNWYSNIRNYSCQIFIMRPPMSLAPGVGKSTVAACLSMALATQFSAKVSSGQMETMYIYS